MNAKIKSWALGLIVLLSVFNVITASASVTLTGPSQVCPGSAVLMNSSRSNAEHYVMLQKKSGSSWVNALTGMTKKSSYVVDMESSAMTFRMVEYGDDNATIVGTSSDLVVSVQTTDCPKVCHQTSTGEYFNGTDFNPLVSNPRIPDGVEHYFEEYSLGFSSGGENSYKVTNDLSGYGFPKPYLDGTSNGNYYYVVDKNATNNSYPFNIFFPKSKYHGKTYRFIMRMYILPLSGCDQWSSSKFIARTQHGTVTTDYMEADFYNDATNQKLGTAYASGTTPNLMLAGNGTNGQSPISSEQWQNYGRTKTMIRVEVTYYGTFPDKQQEEFNFTPMFENVQCAKIAVDYISAEVPSVCMSHGGVCAGSTTEVNAAGFPKDANYKWEKKVGGSWVVFESGEDKQKITIKVESVGIEKYRVSDANDSEVDAIEFEVAGMNCAPEYPEGITGETKLCIPLKTPAVYTVTPADESADVTYGWTLKKGATIIAKVGSGASLENTNTDILDRSSNSDSHYKSVKLNLPTSAEEGEYTLTVQLYKEGAAQGSPVSKTIKVYKKPEPSLQISEPVCPFTDNYVTVLPNNPTKYTYTYGWGDVATSTPNIGKIDFDPTKRCELTSMVVAAQVAVKDMPTCFADAVNWSVAVNNSTPTIDCDKLHDDYLTKGYNDITLAATAKTVNVTLPLPTIGSTCDPNPTIIITGTGVYADGTTFSYSLSKKKNSITTADLTLTLKPTTNATGTNDLEFTYKVKDDCGRFSDECTESIIVRDVTAPDVDCSKIKSYDNVKLSAQLNCVAVPGYNDELPLLSAPSLTDLNGVDGTIQGEYKGRLENPATVPAANGTSEGLFSNTPLNDPYVAGITYILWKFEDKAGNASYCIQHVSVLNDKEPIVTCPSDDYGKFSVDDNCQLSFQKLFPKIPKTKLPTAIDPCPNGSLSFNVDDARLFYREEGEGDDAWVEITSAKYPENLFVLNHAYELQWRYYKQGESAGVDKTVFGKCEARFEVVDSVPPVTDCSSLKDIAVPLNSNSKKLRDFNYASAKLPSTEVPNKSAVDKNPGKVVDDFNTYTLADFFNDFDYPSAEDACNGTIDPVVTVSYTDEYDKETKTTISGTKAQIIEKLKNYKFLEGTSYIRYTYTDNAGNSSYCEQAIMVYSGLFANCPKPLTLKADKDCKAVYDLKPSDVSKALVSYIREFKRKGEDTYTKATDKVQLVKSQAGYDGLKLSTDSMAADKSNKKVEVYPLWITKVTNVTEAGDETPSSVSTKLENGSELTLHPFKVVGHMWYNDAPGHKRWEPLNDPNNIQVWQYLELKTKPFTTTELSKAFLTFDKGIHKLVFHYDNGLEGENHETKECTIIIKVIDDTPPTIECGDWNKTYKVYAKKNCFSDTTIAVPTPTALKAKDNCSKTDDDYTVSWMRNYYKNGYSIFTEPTDKNQDIDAPYGLGETVIEWTIKDASENATYCTTKVVVKDNIGPVFDCGTLKDIKVAADAKDPLCRISATDVVTKGGLKAPTAPNDPCSPVLDASGNPLSVITATGIRVDEPDVDVFSGYYEGTTRLLWTFKDAGEGVTTCPQNVIVFDDTKPTIKCASNVRVTLPQDECTYDASKITLKKPTVSDNCTQNEDDFTIWYVRSVSTIDPSTGKGMIIDDHDAPYPIGQTTITWYVKDLAGNTEHCKHYVIVSDTSIPKGTCPPDVIVDAPKGTCKAAVAIDPTKYKIHDDCDNADLVPVFVSRSDEQVLDADFQVGTTVIRWEYSDASGNKKYCDQNVIVHDITPPVVDCENTDKYTASKPLTIGTKAGECELSAADVVANVELPTASDICYTGENDVTMIGHRYYKGLTGKDKATLVLDIVNNPVQWDDIDYPYAPGYYDIHFIFSDPEGNKDSCILNLYVKDINNPVIDCKKFVSGKTLHPKTDECSLNVKLADLGASTSMKATEFCNPGEQIAGNPYLYANKKRATTTFVSKTVNSGSSIVIHWVFKSQAGVETVCPQTIKVTDNQAPKCTNKTVTAHTDYMPEPSCSVDTTVYLADINATDNCGGTIKYAYKLDDETTYTSTTEDVQLSGLTVGTHKVVWQLTDKYKNTKDAACTTTIVVEDNTKPTCTGDVLEDVPTLADATSCEATVALPLPTGAADNCSNNTLSYRYKVGAVGEYQTISKTTDITLPVGKNTIYWEMSDGINTHAEACSTVVTVLDKTAPYCEDLAMEKVKSDETACSTNVEIALANGAKDDCGSKITYKYSLDGGALQTMSKATKLKLDVGTHEIVWTLSDAKGNSRPDACKTTVTVIGNKKLEPDCNTIAPHLYDTIATCGPSNTVKIKAPTFTDPCYDDFTIKGTTKDNIKSFPLGNTVVTWTFTNKDKTQTAECKQTVSVVTSKKIDKECPKNLTLELLESECTKTHDFAKVYGTEPCTDHILEAKPYFGGKAIAKNAENTYTITLAPGPNTILWVFTGNKDILAKPLDTCKQIVQVGNNNTPPVPCTNDSIFKKLDNSCDIPSTKIDFHNTGVEAAELCGVPGEMVTPDLWLKSNPKNIKHDPSSFGTFHPGKDTLVWEYKFNPSHLGNIMTVQCVQPIEIVTTSKIKLDCEDPSFKTLTFEVQPNTCEVPGDTVTLTPVDGVHPCFDDILIHGVTDHDFSQPYPLGTTTITWTYTDHTWTLTDSVAQCNQDVVVIDKTKPTIVCDDDTTYYLPRDEKGQEALCAAPFADLDIDQPSVTDNCSSDPSDFTISYTRKFTDEKGKSKTTEAEAPFEVGTTVITWTVADKAGNKSSCKQNIVVKDSIAPKPICPEDLVLEAPEGKCDTAIAVVTGETYKYVDPCEGDIIPVGVRDDGKAISDPFPVMKLVTITWTYTDSHNNSSECHQTVFVKDMTKPEVDCRNTNKQIAVKVELGECEVEGSTVVDKVVLPTAVDACQEEAPVMTSSRYYLGRDSLQTPTLVVSEAGDTVRWDDVTVPFKAGYYQIRFIFTDKAGNSDSCVQSVFVEDINPPVTEDCKNVPTPVVLNPANGECDVNIVPTDLNNYQAKEFCTDDLIFGVPALLENEKISEKAIPSTLSSGKSITIRWTYTSQMGYSSFCDQVIKVEDNQPPVIDCDTILDLTLTAEDGKCEISAENADIKYPVAEDNCGKITGRPERYDYDYTANDWTLSEKTMTDAYPTGKTLIRWYFEDTNPENTVHCDQVVFVKGSIAPEINCDTFKTFFDTVPGCETRSVVVRVPNAIDKCAPEELKVVTGVPTRSDGLAMDAQFPLGNTIITWTFTDFTNSISSSCTDTVNVRTQLDLIFSCIDDTTVNVDEGECFKSVSLKVPVADHPCIDTVKVTAVPYLNKTSLAEYVKGDSLIYNYPVGKHTILWIFSDTTESLVRPVDTCKTSLQIGNINQMPVNCDNYPALDTVLKGICSIPASAFNFKDPEVVDLCTNKTIVPDIYLTSAPATIVHDANQLGEFKVGVRDTIVRVFEFKSEGQDISTSIECRQPVWVRDSGNIVANCVPDDSITTLLADGVCEIPMEDVLDSLGTPEATDMCLDHPIPGVAMMTDGSKLPTSIKVGDTLTIMWMFNDSLANADTVYCFQKVTANSNLKPIFTKCDSVNAHELKFVAEGVCEYTFGEGDFQAPIGNDACTGKPYPANGFFKSNNKPIIGTTLSVGNDTIVWVFSSPTSTATDTCEQPIKVRTDLIPDFNCEILSFLDDTISGKCEVSMSDILAKIGNPEATEQCTGSKIPGVPTLVSGDPLPESLAVGDTIVIRWTFAMPEFTEGVKTCDQGITVTGDGKPLFDCSSLEQLNFVAEGECSIVLDEQSIPVPVAKDSCKNTDVPATGVRSDGGELFGTYPLGITTITWTFKSPYSKTPRICEQLVEVKTDKEIDGKCGTENYPTISFNVTEYNCTIPADSVKKKLTAHEAFNPCDESVVIAAVPSRSDNEDMDAPYPIGQTTITWTFTDTTNTLVNPVSTCTQVVDVTDHNDPRIDCPTAFPDTVLYLPDGNCTFDFDAIPVHLDVPVNPCNNEQATVDTVRSSGLAIRAPYGVGKDTLTWTLTFASTNRSATCIQAIEVLDTIAPNFDCDQLKDTIVVALSSGDTVPFVEVQAAGFFIPVVTDVCTEVITKVTREDGKDYTDGYLLGTTKVIFQFSDIYNNTKTCDQVIKVVDMIPPVPTCPELHMTLSCADDTLASYKNYDEFIAAGGSIDDESKINKDAFGHKDVIVGDFCNATITRNYYFLTIREDSVWCQNPQSFAVKDSIKPVYVGIPAEGLTMVTSCDVADTIPPVVSATDNCDPNPVVKMFRVSTQGDDPSKCDYYTYDVKYTWVATDRCGNSADSVTYLVHVKDTVAPIVHAPVGWEVPTHPQLRGECIFLVPDITGLIPNDSVFQNCGSNEYLNFWQEPAAGTRVTESVDIKLHVSDVCGNDTVLTKPLKVQKREDIVKVIAQDKDVCADEEAILNPRGAANSLSNDDVAYSSGRIWVNDFDGSWITVRTNVLWDFFRGSLTDTTVVYSNNDNTYGKRFADAVPLDSAGNAAFARYNLLLRHSQSDTYFFIATDTVSGCSDTAHAYINVLEKPRVKIESGEWTVCDGDSIPVSGGFAAMFNPCVNDMGSAIIEEGWMLNGEPYVPGAEILYADGSNLVAAYYATNACGTGNSLNSLYVSCDGDPVTRADSLVVAGSLANLGLMAEDKLYISDSVKVTVYTHYEPSQVLLTTNPQDKARIWEGDMAELVFTSPYGKPAVYEWKKVVGEYDAEQGAIYDKEGNLISGGSGEDDDEVLSNVWAADDTMHVHYNSRYNVMPSDSSYYYVVVGNGVCPTVSSNLVSIDVMHTLPTAITPYDRDGMNDDFMRGHRVSIFNRYGNLVYEGNNGWDGTFRGLLADPGVYYYEVFMAGGVVRKGSIEVVKIR